VLDTLRGETEESTYQHTRSHALCPLPSVAVSPDREHAPIRSLGERVLDVEVVVARHLAAVDLTRDGQVEAGRHAARVDHGRERRRRLRGGGGGQESVELLHSIVIGWPIATVEVARLEVERGNSEDDSSKAIGFEWDDRRRDER
jgi:hypothetical protein